MIRGTTAQFTFKLPYTKEELSEVNIKFWQPNNFHPFLPIIKTLNHCDGPSNSTDLCVSLTAEETALFSDKYKAKVQFKGIHKDNGTVFASRPQLFTVYPMPDDMIEDNNDEWVILDGESVSNTSSNHAYIGDAGTVSQ